MDITGLIGFAAFTAEESGYIKSIQPVEITIGTGSTSNTAAISAVDTSKTAIFWNGINTTHPGVSAAETLARIELTNGTTVTALRNSSSASYTVTVRATVVEFTSSMVASIQSGTITMGSGVTSNTATISSVNTSTAIVMMMGLTTTHASVTYGAVSSAVRLTDATTVTLSRTTGTDSVTAGYVVIEFNPSVVASLQNDSVTQSGFSSTSTDTISSVDTSRSWLVYGGTNTAISTWQSGMYMAELTNGTTVTFTRISTTSTSRTMYYSVIEFVSGIFNSIQRGTTAVSGTSADTSISSVNTAKTLTLWCGQHTSNTSAAYDNIFASVKLLDATHVRSEKNSSTTSSTASWEAIEFI